MVSAYAQAHPKLIRLKKSFINVVAFCKSKKIKDMISNKIFTTKEKSLAEIDVLSATRTAIVAYAKQFLGNPYVYGGTSLTNGADCSGFTQSVFAHFGITTGRSSRDQAAKGKEISMSAIQPGDLLFYASGSYINHVAIYIGDGKIIHSSNPTTGITITKYNYRTPCKAVTFLD